MKRTYPENNNKITSTNLVSLEGYILHINNIMKNNGNMNHHYSFITCLVDQSTVRVIKYLSKIPSCSLHDRLRESLRSGRGASVTCLKEQNGQYTCSLSTEVIEKEMDFRPDCIRVKNINSLKGEINDRLCTVEAKICEISVEIPVTFEENQFKRVQKLKKMLSLGMRRVH